MQSIELSILGNPRDLLYSNNPVVKGATSVKGHMRIQITAATIAREERRRDPEKKKNILLIRDPLPLDHPFHHPFHLVYERASSHL
jgi:hypothetical protein